MPRRILLAVSGLSPQILTETIYALAISAPEKWIPNEIHLITTLRGLEKAELNLLSGKGWFHRLRRDYDLPPIEFDAEHHIHVIPDKVGNSLEDIRTPEDNEAAADCITEWVRRLTLDSTTELHVSIAGGRKTMGYFVGYALSLFGRDQDRLSHVLVSAPYESHRDFFYPTPYEQVIHTEGTDARTVDCRQARVWLADIPFVRLRDGVPAPLLNGRTSFSRTVAAIQRPGPVSIAFDPANLAVTLGNYPVKLTGAHYGLYAWMARRAKESLPPLSFDRKDSNKIQPADALRKEYERIDPDLLGGLAKVEQAIKNGIDSGWFSTNMSRLNAKLEEALGSRVAMTYQIQSLSEKTLNKARGKQVSYAVTVPPESIDMGD